MAKQRGLGSYQFFLFFSFPKSIFFCSSSGHACVLLSVERLHFFFPPLFVPRGVSVPAFQRRLHYQLHFFCVEVPTIQQLLTLERYCWGPSLSWCANTIPLKTLWCRSKPDRRKYSGVGIPGSPWGIWFPITPNNFHFYFYFFVFFFCKTSQIQLTKTLFWQKKSFKTI